ncbi:MAG: alpha/beta fold hydrolase, partial [Candidatus Dormibacteraeota bacterium]|nr:alpha/beta fold hydrolase [Candidatus Dormibacteraeota bacterium]
AELTFKEGHVEADGFRVRYSEAGEGEPLVVLHGAGGMRISRSHELLAERRRVVALQVPGFGDSAPNERSASMSELAGSLGEAVANLGLERFSLMGSSFGGTLALWLAVRSSERVQALVLAAPAAIRPDGHSRPQVSPEEWRGMLYAHPERQPPMPPVDPAVTAKQDALVRRLSRVSRDPDLEARLADLSLPVLVLFGTKDRVIPPEMGRAYRELLPSCHFVLVYDAAHAVDADRPEAFVAIVDDFLDRQQGFLVATKSGVLYP